MRSQWLVIGQVLFFMLMADQNAAEVYKHPQKECGQYRICSIWSIKDLLHMTQRTHFSYWAEQVMLSRPDSPIVPTQAGNHSPGFGSSWLLAELASY